MPADNRWWDPVDGDDANDGSAVGTPVRTLARAVAVSTDGGRVYCEPGVYPTSILGTSSFIAKALSFEATKRGQVIFDFEGLTHASTAHINTQAAVIFSGIEFRNPATGKYLLATFSGAVPIAINCVFTQRDGGANVGNGVYKSTVKRCSFYNLSTGFYGADFGTPVGSCSSSYFKDVTTPVSAGSTADYNAYPANVEANGIDTDDANSDPGFVAPESDDYRLDPTDTVALAKFRSLGVYSGAIGASGGGPTYDYEHAQLRLMVPIPAQGDGGWGVYVNDPDYVDPAGLAATGTIIEDPATFEPILDGISGGALSGRLLGPVWDRGVLSATWNALTIGAFEDLPAGAVLDNDTGLPQTFDYRVSNSSFGQTDQSTGSPTWVEWERGDEINKTERYLQEAITFQADHSGA